MKIISLSKRVELQVELIDAIFDMLTELKEKGVI